MNNIDFSLPIDWTWDTLDSVGNIYAGSSAPQDEKYFIDGTFPFVRVQDLGREKRTTNLTITVDKLNSLAINECHLVKAKPGTILFPKSGAAILTNNRALLGMPAYIVSHLAAIEPNQEWDEKWVFYWLCLVDMRQYINNPAYPSLNLTEIKKIPIPKPRTRQIQRQIVARIEALLSEVREMREINQRIIEDTRQLLGAFLNQIFENLPGKENKPIDEVGFVKGGKRLPKGENFAIQPTPYPYLRVTDFRNFGIDESDLRYLTPEVHAQIRNYIISDQDVFISIAGTIGLVGTVPTHLNGSNLTENAAKIVFRPEYQDKIKNKYLMYFLASPQGKKQIEARTKAAGQPKLALERIKTITFPYIDSIPQQEAIIEKIEAVQSEVTEMLRTQQADEKCINQLEESILAQAFRGEL